MGHRRSRSRTSPGPNKSAYRQDLMPALAPSRQTSFTSRIEDEAKVYVMSGSRTPARLRASLGM